MERALKFFSEATQHQQTKHHNYVCKMRHVILQYRNNTDRHFNCILLYTTDNRYGNIKLTYTKKKQSCNSVLVTYKGRRMRFLWHLLNSLWVTIIEIKISVPP